MIKSVGTSSSPNCDDLPSEGYTEEELTQFLAEKFSNADMSQEELIALPNERHQQALLNAKEYANHKISSKDVPGYDPASPQHFNVGLIQELMDRKLEEIDIDFVKSRPEALASTKRDPIVLQELLKKMYVIDSAQGK